MTAIRVIAGMLMLVSSLLMLPDAFDRKHPEKLRLLIGFAAGVLAALGMGIIGGGAP